MPFPTNALLSKGPPRRTNALAQDVGRMNFGNRPDGTPKGEGWLGLLKRPDGALSTEISAGVEIDGREVEIPLLVPTLSADEVKYLLNTDVQGPAFYQSMPPTIMQKAYAHALQRMTAGRSPFKD